MEMPKKLSIEKFLWINAICLASVMGLILILPRLNARGSLELYDLRDTEQSGVPYKIGYLKWHGGKTELEIWAMTDMRSGRHYYVTVEDEDTFTVEINSYKGWAEFYVNDDMIAVLYRSGELDDC
jgi:hypothetical protein